MVSLTTQQDDLGQTSRCPKKLDFNTSGSKEAGDKP